MDGVGPIDKIPGTCSAGSNAGSGISAGPEITSALNSFESRAPGQPSPKNCSPTKIRWVPHSCLWHFRAIPGWNRHPFYLH